VFNGVSPRTLLYARCHCRKAESLRPRQATIALHQRIDRPVQRTHGCVGAFQRTACSPHKSVHKDCTTRECPYVIPCIECKWPCSCRPRIRSLFGACTCDSQHRTTKATQLQQLSSKIMCLLPEGLEASLPIASHRCIQNCAAFAVLSCDRAKQSLRVRMHAAPMVSAVAVSWPPQPALSMFKRFISTESLEPSDRCELDKHPFHKIDLRACRSLAKD
jgi:hypothetical protein